MFVRRDWGEVRTQFCQGQRIHHVHAYQTQNILCTSIRGPGMAV